MKEQVYLALLAEVWLALFPEIVPSGTVEDCADNMRTEILRLKEVDYIHKELCQ